MEQVFTIFFLGMAPDKRLLLHDCFLLKPVCFMARVKTYETNLQIMAGGPEQA